MSAATQLLTRATRLYAALRHAAASSLLRNAYFGVLALVALWPTLGHASLMNEFADAQYFQLFEEVARQSVSKFHELPLWDPYYCGGIPGLATPSARFVSPTFLLTLLFGTFRGAGLTAFAMTWLGLEGTFRFARSRGAGSLAAMTAAPVFALCGIFGRSEVLGWTNFLGFELVPWALFGLRLASRGRRAGVALAVVALAWMIGFGGTYAAPITVIAIVLDGLMTLAAAAQHPGRAVRVIESIVTIGLLSLAVSAVRLWPIAETLSSSPRILGGALVNSPSTIWGLLCGTHPFGAWRDDFFIGVLVLPLVAYGAWQRKALAMTALAVFALWLALGQGGRVSLFAVLRTLPPYTMLRAPERFLVLVALMAAAVSAVGIRRIEAAARAKQCYVGLALACHVALLGDTWLLVENEHSHASTKQLAPAPPDASFADFRQSRGNRWLATYYPFMNRGSLTCFDDYDVAQSPLLRGDLGSEEYLRDTRAGVVTRSAWSPGRIDLHTALTRPARVYVNQNWHPGWRSSTGAVVSEDGLLAVDMPAGIRDVTLRFLPRSVVGGLAASLVGLGVVGVLLWRDRRAEPTTRERLVTLAACLAPFGAALLAVALMPEPRRPPPSLLTPSGDSMVLDAPPVDTEPIGARWGEGITLEAARVQVEPRSDRRSMEATVELDWKVDRTLPAGLGVFVFFERDGGRVGADHVLLSGVVSLEDAPLSRTLRDVGEAVSLPPGPSPGEWTVHVGIWRARGDGGRLEVAVPGPRGGKDNAVLVATFTSP